MKRPKNKQKGNSFERQCAKLMTEITQVKWIRTPTSGALATLHNTNQFRGDIWTESKVFEDNVKKNHEAIDIVELVDDVIVEIPKDIKIK